MNIREIKDLIHLMNEHALSEIELESEGMKIKLKKTGSGVALERDAGTPAAAAGGRRPAVETALDENAAVPKASHLIKSPMVGTFYAAPAPDAEPYVKAGSKVEIGQVICIIEAMKLMNEIKSEIRGVVTDIKVASGDPVEFGQPLFIVT